jgi:hypothetical protein
MMGKLNSPDGYVSQVDIKTQSGKKRIKAGRDGRYVAEDPAVVSALKQAGFTEAGISTYGGSNLGYTCVQCGFGSWFKTCSRCGHENSNPSRDGEIDGNGGTN